MGRGGMGKDRKGKIMDMGGKGRKGEAEMSQQTAILPNFHIWALRYPSQSGPNLTCKTKCGPMAYSFMPNFLVISICYCI